MALCFSITESVIAQGNNVIIPEETIELFNGEDLSGFYTWLVDHESEGAEIFFRRIELHPLT